MNAFITPRVFPANFVDHLHSLATQRPGDTALIVVSEKNGVATDTGITYQQLDLRVRALAARLQRQFRIGDRALLLLDNDDNYVVGFFACLYAGLIAVPLFPPTSLRPQHLARLVGVARDADAVCVMTTTNLQSSLDLLFQDQEKLAAVAVDATAEHLAGEWVPHALQSSDIAFLQYTSGSTSAPKGVMVSHGNLMANERAIESALAVQENDVFVSWLPLYHDMGLIGGLLQPIHRGIPAVLMTPQFFLEKPLRWLEAIGRHRGTISGGPDFSFRLCIERISDAPRKQLDLSSWRLAFSGAEPVRRDTLDEFIESFAEAGFSSASVYPCYGLAEATLLVTGGAPCAGMTANTFSTPLLAQGIARLSRAGSELVSSGHVVTGHVVAIVDTQSYAKLDDGQTGEIWVSGPSVAQGYWKKPDETAATFVERNGQRWLRTGDYGVIVDGQVYIVGRIKDLIIVRGHNLYPQDIERAIEDEIDVIRKGRITAFSVTTPRGEGIGIAVELSRRTQKLVQPAQLIEILNSVVSQQCGEPLSVIALLDSGMLPKTSSGKLQRSACSARWNADDFGAYALYSDGKLRIRGQVVADEVATSLPDASGHEDTAALNATEMKLAGLWSQSLRLTDASRLHRGSHFLVVGGSSIAAAQLAFLIAEHWQVEFPLRTFFESPYLGEQAKEVDRRCDQGRHYLPLVIPRLSDEQRKSGLPLSHGQERQWFLWQLDTNSTAYHIGGVVHLYNAPLKNALQAALDDLITRHASLRTVFRCNAEGEVGQFIEPSAHLPMAFIDLSEAPAPQRELRQRDEIQQIANEQFDLEHGPLLRCALVRVDNAKHALIIVIHHIVSDGVSLQLLIDELSQRYVVHRQSQVLSSSQMPELPAPAIQYADFAVWQRQWLAQGESERQLDWWRNQLGNEHPVLQLPTDRPRPAQARYSAARYRLAMPAALPDQLRESAHSQQATLFMVFLAGFQSLLYRYSGQHDIRVGVPVANRNHAQTQNVLGFFVNTLVMRNVLHGRTSLTQILTQARDMVLGAQEHQDLPFELLVEALRPERSLSHTPLFQVAFNHLYEDFRALKQLSSPHHEPQDSYDLREAVVERIDGAAQFELTLEAREQPDGSVQLDLIYATELFDAQTMARFGEHYVRVLQQFARDPQQMVGDIELLEATECRQLQAWSSNTTRYQGESLHRLFEQQAELRPDVAALIFNNDSLTYGELNTRANQLAHRLLKQGVQRESRVGIAVERSLDMVIGLLAILKAGATYVPLDPEYPPQRLHYIVEDSGVHLLLTQRHVQALFPSFPSHHVLLLDTLDLAAEPCSNPPLDVHGENIAYVIYTSGSTGLPKGAGNRHAAVASCMQWMQDTYNLTAADTVLHKAPFGFDVSVWEIFWPLTAGARLVIAGPGDHRDPDRLIELIRLHQITTVNFVPSMLQAFLECDGIEHETSLRYVICGGEAMPAATQKNALQRLRGASLKNLYGPTETAIHITQWTCRDDGRAQVPIGRPIAASQTYVLDTDLNLVPQGVAGELYLGGVGLGRGYLNRAALTAERFIANPFISSLEDNGSRLYRTGDLVRWNSEGQLEYLGRVDHQVKVRGFRIELGEIEAQLLAQPDIREAVVVAKDNLQLIAYIAPEVGAQIDLDILKQELAKVLPDYMVPRVVVELPALPLNENGKVDRKALPRPEFAATQAYEPTRGKTEQALAQIWCDVLGIERVGRNDNFFDLGGHSLHLTRVKRAVEKTLGTVAISDLFKYPNISALARWLESNPADSAASDREFLIQQETRAQQQRAARLRRKSERATS